MGSYNDAFSQFYDVLTGNIDYNARADFLLAQVVRHGGRPSLVLDLACGTGSLALALAGRGLEVIGVDGSPEMLSQGMNKSAGVTPPVLFLCQEMAELDLYGTVDTAFCVLDSFNHLKDAEQLNRVLGRLRNFVEPGGFLVFDLNTPYKHREILGNNTFVYDLPEVYCVWQNSLGQDDSVDIALDFFVPAGNSWRREEESFREVIFPGEQIRELLAENGFTLLEELGDYAERAPGPCEERIIYISQRM